jgi:hypothetical protein
MVRTQLLLERAALYNQQAVGAKNAAATAKEWDLYALLTQCSAEDCDVIGASA